MGGPNVNLDTLTSIYEGLGPDDHPSSKFGRTRDLSLKDAVNAAFIRYRVFTHWTNTVRTVKLPWESSPSNDSIILGPGSVLDLSFNLRLYEDEEVTFSVHAELSESNRISGCLVLRAKTQDVQSVSFDDMRKVDLDAVVDEIVDKWIVMRVMEG